MDRTALLIEHFQSVRRYTIMTVDGIDHSQWFHIPDGAPTHIAWQIGHMAIAQYGLALSIPRGKKIEDQELIPDTFRQHFSRGSVPNPDPASNPSIETILNRFNAVYDQVLKEIPTFSEELLDQPSGVDHPMFDSKFGSLMWCIHHEYTHAGQISLLYRLLGGKPRF